jgi:hypothetical protein
MNATSRGLLAAILVGIICFLGLAGREDRNVVVEPSVGWEFAGPSTYVNHQLMGHTSLSSAAAIQNVVQGANSTWFIGSVNGGVWRTSSLDSRKIQWHNVLDGQPVTCSSISALHATSTRIYAACGGSTSSEQGTNWNVVNSGDWSGVMVSSDKNGDTWQMLDSFSWSRLNLTCTIQIEVGFGEPNSNFPPRVHQSLRNGSTCPRLPRLVSLSLLTMLFWQLMHDRRTIAFPSRRTMGSRFEIGDELFLGRQVRFPFILVPHSWEMVTSSSPV